MQRNYFFSICFLFFFFCGFSQTTKRKSIYLEHGAHRLGKRTDSMMQRWRNYGFGQFIHWGVYAIPGGQWNGQEYGGAAEWIRAWDGMPNEEYDKLYQQFNPLQFDAHEWALQAKQMGARYVILTTKHHDGFCLWPSKYTEYDVENTPYQKDIIGALVDAYNEQGIDVYLYFSIIDWNHPQYHASLETDEDKEEYELFKEFTRNQLVELLERYPTTKGLWFDGSWESAWKEQAEFADQLGAEVRELIPGLIIGSRFRPDEYGNRHFDANGDLIGDYEQGWERKLPDSIEDVYGNDWDAVMTIPENQWGYKKNWSTHVKSAYELLEMMVKSVSLDGNFVLNFGPKGDGSIRVEESELAIEIGKWMDTNKAAIYNCGHLNWKKQDWGYYTENRETKEKYMVVFHVPMSNKFKIEVPEGVTLQQVTTLNNQTSFPVNQFKNQSYSVDLTSGISNRSEPVVFRIIVSNVQGEEMDTEAKT